MRLLTYLVLLLCANGGIPQYCLAGEATMYIKDKKIGLVEPLSQYLPISQATPTPSTLDLFLKSFFYFLNVSEFCECAVGDLLINH